MAFTSALKTRKNRALVAMWLVCGCGGVITLSLIKNYYFFMELTTVLSYQLQEEVFLIKDKLCEDTVHGHYY